LEAQRAGGEGKELRAGGGKARRGVVWRRGGRGLVAAAAAWSGGEASGAAGPAAGRSCAPRRADGGEGLRSVVGGGEAAGRWRRQRRGAPARRAALRGRRRGGAARHCGANAGRGGASARRCGADGGEGQRERAASRWGRRREGNFFSFFCFFYKNFLPEFLWFLDAIFFSLEFFVLDEKDCSKFFLKTSLSNFSSSKLFFLSEIFF